MTTALERKTSMTDQQQTGTTIVKRGLARMLKGGVIMDVVTPEQAVIAQEAGAVAVMALERIPADIRKMGGVARMSNLNLVQEIMDAVTIPVMAKTRIGHLGEAACLAQMQVDFIDESEVLCRPTTAIISRRATTRCPSSAAPAIWVKRFVASPKVRR